jgi:hypothetical protein
MAESKILEDPEFLAGPQIAAVEVLERVFEWETSDRGMHLEGAVVTLGALAGKACQVAMLVGVEAKDPVYLGLSVADVTGVDGTEFYFGDAINRPLVESTYSVWSLVAGAANSLGATVPEVTELFEHAASSVGTPEFGVPRYAAGTHAEPPLTYLARWDELLPIIRKHAPDAQQWPVVFGIAIQQLFTIAGGDFNLTILTRIFMDSAIAMSKLKQS